ncbi:MAG: hypothetical protein ACI4MJ_02550 [Aristaeellaceae bacterium]
MKQEPVRRVLLLYKSMIPSVLLCGHCQLKDLAARGAVAYRDRTVMQVSKDDLSWADTVLMCRPDSIYERQLAQMVKAAGKTLAYIIDDDLLHVPMTLTSAPYYTQKEAQQSIRTLISLSDAVISPSPVLLGKYAQEGRKGILLEEPAIDPVHRGPRTPDRPVSIGFAGSVDRAGDIEQLLKDTLLRIHSEYGSRVTFTFFGAVPSFAGELDARCIPYCDSYDAYRRTLNALQLDIGLAPMPDTPFHACKHYNKFVEYAAAGIVGIFSDVQPYTRLREQFGWELLCENTADSWYTLLKRLIDHPDEVERIRARQEQLVDTVFSVPVIAEQLHQSLNALPHPAQQTPLRAPFLPVQKVQAQIRRIISGLKRYGLRTPVLLLRRLFHD